MLAKELRYAFYVMVRPFDGFWDLKHEKRGSFKAAMIVLTAALFTYVLAERYTGFLFNRVNLIDVNLIREVFTFLLVYVLFVVSNWCLTSLMDGKGNMKDIAIATAYALTPYILMTVPMVILSNFITIEEGAFYYLFTILGIIWSGFLIITGTMTTHEYSMSKTIGTMFLIILSMLIMVFLGLLFISVIQRMAGFVYVLYKELAFRF